MKTLLSFIVLMFFLQIGWSQNENLDFKYAVKLYNLTSFEDKSKKEIEVDSSIYVNSYDIIDKTLQIFHPTVAFQWKTKKNNFHEIELTNISLDNTEARKDVETDTLGIYETIIGGEIFTTYVSLRYEFIWNLNISGENKFVPSLGFGINPYYRQSIYKPMVTDEYRTSEILAGARVFVIPRLTYNISAKFFIDINIPICFFDIHFQSDKDQDPRLTIEEQTTNTANLHAFPQFFSGRIGVGIKLN